MPVAAADLNLESAYLFEVDVPKVDQIIRAAIAYERRAFTHARTECVIAVASDQCIIAFGTVEEIARIARIDPIVLSVPDEHTPLDGIGGCVDEGERAVIEIRKRKAALEIRKDIDAVGNGFDADRRTVRKD